LSDHVLLPFRIEHLTIHIPVHHVNHFKLLLLLWPPLTVLLPNPILLLIVVVVITIDIVSTATATFAIAPTLVVAVIVVGRFVGVGEVKALQGAACKVKDIGVRSRVRDDGLQHLTPSLTHQQTTVLLR
jgi:hypothetical protein